MSPKILPGCADPLGATPTADGTPMVSRHGWCCPNVTATHDTALCPA
jgi:hypothetical protein